MVKVRVSLLHESYRSHMKIVQVQAPLPQTIGRDKDRESYGCRQRHTRDRGDDPVQGTGSPTVLPSEFGSLTRGLEHVWDPCVSNPKLVGSTAEDILLHAVGSSCPTMKGNHLLCLPPLLTVPNALSHAETPNPSL
jgi:hypothetical protein